MSLAEVLDMTSAFRAPDPKKPVSLRLRGSSVAKVKALVAIWQERLKATGQGEDADEVDQTYVIDLLLAKALDDELAQWGGYPETDAKMAAVLKQVRADSKQ